MAYRTLSKFRKNLTSFTLDPTSPDDLTRDKTLRRARSKDSARAQESLKELNGSLITLASIFPDVQVEVFREMLSTFDKESRLHVVTEALLRHKTEWVKGRWKTHGKDCGGRNGDMGSKPLVPVSSSEIQLVEKFRSRTYRHAVRSAFKSEFPALSTSAIDAVLAENNFWYSASRPTLITLSSKSWRHTLTSFFLRRKPQNAAKSTHPLIEYADPSNLTVKTTGSTELDQELYDTLVAPFMKAKLDALLFHDFSFATNLNQNQAEESGDLHDCECCYVSAPFENFSACSDDGHFVCFRCVRHTVNEAIYGQGWNQSVDLARNSLKCIAISSPPCSGYIPINFIQRAFEDESKGRDIFRQFEDRLSAAAVSSLQAPLIQCPFCTYTEVDDIFLTRGQQQWTLKNVTFMPLNEFFFRLIVLLIILPLTPFIAFIDSPWIASKISSSVHRIARQRRTRKFACQSPACGRVSCINCAKPWHDPHICYESERLRYESHISNALSAALKRTCPRCSVSFVKSSGCNKLTCVCGYKMCYVCRAELGTGDTGYSHFCEHFRPAGRGCDCNKCDLYREEDEQIMLKRARQEAEETWKQNEGGLVVEPRAQGHTRVQQWRDLMDTLIDSMIELPL